MKDLSILIPARNEMFLARTVQDILDNIEGNTEIIVGLDGVWDDPKIPEDKRVKVVYYPESIGQRAMTNQLCKLSDAKYIIKCDAHCAFDKGFDVKLMADMQDDWTMVPVMRNLHAFNWVCPDGHIRYQGPSGPCKDCGKPTTRDVVWIAKASPQSRSYCFDAEPHFQYFGEYNKRPEGKPENNNMLTDTMSLQGSFFMLTRKKYWELNICDEAFGSWGSQGIEVAAKTWLSGGRVVCNHKTWYAHMFRTQGGDFSFPYEMRHSKVQEAKKMARELFFNSKWDKAIYPLSWLVEKFWPVKGWRDEDLKKLKESENNRKFATQTTTEKKPTRGIIFFTDNQLKISIAHAVQKQLRKISESKKIPIVSASLKPMNNMGKNIHVNMERGYRAYFTQIVEALKASDADVIFFTEHDVLYHPSHFDFIPPKRDTLYYDHNWWKVRSDGFAVHWDADQVSGLCGYRDVLLDYYTKRLESFDENNFNRRFEPMSRAGAGSWKAPYPCIDIRHKGTLTKDKWSPNDFRDKSTCVNWQESTIDKIPGWDGLSDIIPKITA